MTREARHVHSDPLAVARLEALVAALPNGAHVAVRLADDHEITGIVAARPVLQQFFDAAGNEGSNAVLRLESAAPHEPMGVRDVWLDEIVGIRDLGPPRQIHH